MRQFLIRKHNSVDERKRVNAFLGMRVGRKMHRPRKEFPNISA